jgi:transposase-like protein
VRADRHGAAVSQLPLPDPHRRVFHQRIESVNACIRRAVRGRGNFQNEAAALESVDLAVMSLRPTG